MMGKSLSGELSCTRTDLVYTYCNRNVIENLTEWETVMLTH